MRPVDLFTKTPERAFLFALYGLFTELSRAACIAFVIGLSACLALSIREAADRERESGLSDLSNTATIRVDRQFVMEDVRKNAEETEEPDSGGMKDWMSPMKELFLEELKTCAQAKSAHDFYHTESVSLNTSSIKAVSTSSDTTDAAPTDTSQKRGFPQQERGTGGMQHQGDFTMTGYSSYAAITAFADGSAQLSEGVCFAEGDDALMCIIHQELATLNNLSIGDATTFTNPAAERETYKVRVVGIYTSTKTVDSFMGVNMTDPANQIYMSYEALRAMVERSTADTDTTLHAQTRGTYVFENVEAYDKFEAQVRKLGLSDIYTVPSEDVTAYEQGLAPLENLSTYAGCFLVVVLLVGGVILVVLNIYYIRERKYEIGVLAAIDMNKCRIALQFVCEILIVTLMATILDCGIGAAASIPLTNTLLQTQTVQTSAMQETDFPEEGGPQIESGGKSKGMEKETVSYIQEISSAANGEALLELGGIAILLTLLSAVLAVLRILRYEPLNILSNRE